MTKPHCIRHRSVQFTRTGRSSKDQIPIEGRMAWHQRAGKAVMCRHRQPLALRLVQPRVSGNDPDGGILRRGEAVLQQDVGAGTCCRRAKAAKLVTQLPGRGPEMGHPIRRRCTARIHRHQRANRDPVLQHNRRRTEPSLDRPGHRTITGTGATKVKVIVTRPPGRHPKTGIGIVRPALVAAIQQVEQDGCRHDRDFLAFEIKADAGSAKRVGNAGRGIKTKSRSAGQHKSVDIGDELVGCQKICLARSGRAAHDVNRGGEGIIGTEHRHPGFQRRIMGVANLDAVNIGDQIAWSCLHPVPT